MQTFATAREAAYALRPDQPVYCFMPQVLTADALAFTTAFPGKTAYAVKTNGEPMVLKTLAKAGIDCFDVASPGRVRSGQGGRPEGGAPLHPPGQGPVRHPARARDLWHPGDGARPRGRGGENPPNRPWPRPRPEEITLLVRLASRGHAAYELSKKFGAAPAHAVELVQRIHRIGFKVGLCFHVGSQVEDTDTYERALASAAWVRSRAGVADRAARHRRRVPGAIRPRPAAEGARDAGGGRPDRRSRGRDRRMGIRRPAARRRARPGDRARGASR